MVKTQTKPKSEASQRAMIRKARSGWATVQRHGGSDVWDTPAAFIAWYLLETREGTMQRRDESQPHGPKNTYFGVRHPRRAECIRIIAEAEGWSLSAVEVWASKKSRQEIHRKADTILQRQKQLREGSTDGRV